MTAPETSLADEDGGRAALWRFRRKKASVIALADRARDAAQWELAARLYRKALDRNPRNPPIWVQYGHALKESANLAAAEAAYRTAIAYDPRAADSHLQLGHVLKIQGKKEEADTAYLRALVLEPESSFAPEELRGLGWSAAEMHELYRMLDGAERPPNAAALRPGPSKPVENAVIRCLKAPVLGEEVALLVTHSPDGKLKPRVRHYLDSLQRHGIAVILIVAPDKPFAADTDLVNATDGMFIRDNEGFDFAAWTHVLRLYPELFTSKVLYLTNDSMVGPLNDHVFATMLRRLRASSADVIGLTDNFERGWHISSYFLAFKNSALKSSAFRQFLDGIVSYGILEDVINQCEIRLASILAAAGLNCEALFPAKDELSQLYFYWKDLVRSGFPFVKLKVLRGVNQDFDISNWEEIISAHGFDISLLYAEIPVDLQSATTFSGNPPEAPSHSGHRMCDSQAIVDPPAIAMSEETGSAKVPNMRPYATFPRLGDA